jgi:hypothetical protein
VLDHLRLVSPAPKPLASGSPDGIVTAGGKIQHAGAGWLVLGNTYSPGWKATCRDKTGNEHDLGAPTEIAGFANGWPITGASCVSAKFTFGPQMIANIFYWVSAAVVFALIVLLIVIRRRSRSESNLDRDPEDLEAGDDAQSDGFSMPTGVEWVSAILYGAAAVLIIATVAIYIATPAPSTNPVGFGFASERIDAHWTAFFAIVFIAVGGLVEVFSIRRGRESG